jgi:hypothetical protein
VEPNISWPSLSDSGPRGKEVEDFYMALEEVFGQANNGIGMSPKEIMVAMRGCLQGSRWKIYDDIAKHQREPGTNELSDP